MLTRHNDHPKCSNTAKNATKTSLRPVLAPKTVRNRVLSCFTSLCGHGAVNERLRWLILGQKHDAPGQTAPETLWKTLIFEPAKPLLDLLAVVRRARWATVVQKTQKCQIWAPETDAMQVTNESIFENGHRNARDDASSEKN